MTKDRDDIIRILKEVCGSARDLIAAVNANKLKPPYQVYKGASLQLPCVVPTIPTTTTTTKPITTTTTKPTTTTTKRNEFYIDRNHITLNLFLLTKQKKHTN